MKLLEHQGKALLTRHGIPTPRGVVLSSVEEFGHHSDRLPLPNVVKAQVLVGGRGKAGGIQPASSVAETKEKVRQVLGMSIKGFAVHGVLVEEQLHVAKELYAAVLIDRASRMPLFMVSAAGGVDIESTDDTKIHKVTVNPLVGFQPYHARSLTGALGLDASARKQTADILRKLYEVFRTSDAELVEVNPLVLTKDGRVVAADAKVVLNDAALYRHPEFQGTDEELTPLEQEAKRQNIAFVQLPGRIGVIANGAGLTMATLDALLEFQGRAGVFLDLGGTDDPEQVQKAVRILKKASPSVVLLNLFGGITKCDTVAKGLKAVIDSEGFAAPFVARIKGTNEKEAREILSHAGFVTANTLQDAARLAVEEEKKVLAKRSATATAPRSGR